MQKSLMQVDLGGRSWTLSGLSPRSLRARLHSDVIGNARSDKNLSRTRRPHLPRRREKRHTQRDLKRLGVNLMEIDVMIAREIEALVDTQHAGPSAEIFLLLLVAKHQKGGIDGDIATDPAVRRFRGPYVTTRYRGRDEANSGCVDAYRDPGTRDWDLCPLGHRVGRSSPGSRASGGSPCATAGTPAPGICRPSGRCLMRPATATSTGN